MTNSAAARHGKSRWTLAACFGLLLASGLGAQVAPRLLSGLRWRSIGPFRGGRVLAVTGVPGHPNTFYFGSVDGGIWKSTDAGRDWRPLLNHAAVASIGAIAVAPSNPDVIYAGAGEADMRSDMSLGGGMYKSINGGHTWHRDGLANGLAFGRILVSPQDPDRVLAAVLGDPYGPSATRGVFLTSDGGAHWRKVLGKGDNTGAIDLSFDPANPRVVYAALWQVRRPFWSTYAPLSGPGGGIYKSLDGGATWREIIGHGLPPKPYGRIGIAAAAGHRVYAIIRANRRGGVYRSDNSGASWLRVSRDPRIRGRSWYFSSLTVDPRNANVVYAVNTSLYRSSDGGRHFHPIEGAPGGNDYHILWVAARHPHRMILGSDQGVKVTLNGGRTWSSWYNQPTGQFYHVALDHQFPYNVYGAQQDSGTLATISRDNDGEITGNDWFQVGGGESGYIAPDPLHPDIIFAGNYGGGVSSFNRVTGQVRDISPAPVPGPDGVLRFTWTSPLVFSPRNPHELYFGAQYVYETDNYGQSWRRISPDLTLGAHLRPAGMHPSALLQDRRARHAGVVYTIAPSRVAAGEIWVGTDNGLIQLTRNHGQSWQNVTPAGLPAWSEVSMIAASPFAAGTAYAAVNRRRLDDRRPYIYRTRDYGAHWRLITRGLRAPAYVHAILADPVRRGLLYTGTETGVDVSFDNGGHWQPLQLNLPTCSIRDLAIRDQDLVVATHGRSFWVLDDISPLRQLHAADARRAAVFYRPRTAIRIRRDVNTDTPFSVETPAGANPPDGATLYYYLGQAPATPLRLAIYDARGQLIRQYTNVLRRHALGPKNVPAYWLRPPVQLSARAGLNRFVWSLRYPHPDMLHFDYTIAAIPHATPRRPRGPLVLPGRYTVKLIVNGHAYTQPLVVKNDPRVRIAPAALASQLQLELRIVRGLDRDARAIRSARALAAHLRRAHRSAALQRLQTVLGAAPGGAFHFHARSHAPTLIQLSGYLSLLYTSVSGADAVPTRQQSQLTASTLGELHSALAKIQALSPRPAAGAPAGSGGH